MTRTRIAIALIGVAVVIAASCTGDSNKAREIDAEFTRAVQVFPGVKVKVLGVDVGQVTSVDTRPESVIVTMRITDENLKLPADAGATIVPASLLGERYVQLTPTYQGGAQLEDGASIPIARTKVPAEGDELLRAVQDYLGALDQDTVEEFITNAATVLEGKGERLNRLVKHGTVVFKTLASQRDELANMIVQFNQITQALATRQDALGRVINSYNVVGTTINNVRGDLEGTIEGLNLASAELADILIGHQGPLGADVKSLTRTTRTLQRNVHRFANTGHWATRLFDSASRAVNFKSDWLRLGNQGSPIPEMLALRLEDRLMGLCMRLGNNGCQQEAYWEQRFPELFCPAGDCATPKKTRRINRSAEEALQQLPEQIDKVIDKAAKKNCRKAKNPKRCRKRKRDAQDAIDGGATDDLEELIDDIVGDVDDTIGGGL